MQTIKISMAEKASIVGGMELIISTEVLIDSDDEDEIREIGCQAGKMIHHILSGMNDANTELNDE